jgi:murein DD-endopeptidase MepM/ murein hydrolase activator NlpD
MKDSNQLLFRFCFCALVALSLSDGYGQAFSTTRLADGFDYPVGKPDGAGYYVFRGFTPGGHLGEDWNGSSGGNNDLGDSVYAIAHGVVVFSEDYRKGWGNVIIVRHAFRGRDGQISFVDSLYGHLNDRFSRLGDHVVRGQKIGTIGRGPNNMYVAHLHFEIRQDLRVGMRRDLYPQTYSTFTVGGPRGFLKEHRNLRYESRMVRVPINTFQASAVVANKLYSDNIAVPQISTTIPAGPALSEDIGEVISEEADPKSATPAATRTLLQKLLGN